MPTTCLNTNEHLKPKKDTFSLEEIASLEVERPLPHAMVPPQKGEEAWYNLQRMPGRSSEESGSWPQIGPHVLLAAGLFVCFIA